MTEATGWLALYDDDLSEAARDSFAREFDLPALTLPTHERIEALHQELRLAIGLWYDLSEAGAVWHTKLDQLSGRDRLRLAVGPDGQKRIVRVR